MTNGLIRETNSRALLNNDIKALEEYKFRKNTLREINNLKETVLYLSDTIESLKNEIEMIRNKKG